jgi:hypothetical protein
MHGIFQRRNVVAIAAQMMSSALFYPTNGMPSTSPVPEMCMVLRGSKPSILPSGKFDKHITFLLGSRLIPYKLQRSNLHRGLCSLDNAFFIYPGLDAHNMFPCGGFRYCEPFQQIYVAG